MSAGAIIAIAAAAVAVLAAVVIYNRLVSLRNGVKNAFSQIGVQLTRRHDLIPNLLETVKGYMAHEKEVFEEVATTRSRAVDANQQAGQAPGDPQAVSALAGAEGALTGALGRLFAVMENYPDLKASRNAAQLQEDLTNTENKVAFARQAYNDAVMRYNNARQAFPAVVIAGPLGFRDAAFLEFEDAAMQKPPKVQF